MTTTSIPSTFDGLYERERAAGKTHEEARDIAGHGYGRRGRQLEDDAERARRKFEAKQGAPCPGGNSHSSEESV